MQAIQFYLCLLHFIFFTSIRKRFSLFPSPSRSPSLSTSLSLAPQPSFCCPGTGNFFRIVIFVVSFITPPFSSVFLSILRKCAVHGHKTQAKPNYALYAASTSFSRLFLHGIAVEFFAKHIRFSKDLQLERTENGRIEKSSRIKETYW